MHVGLRTKEGGGEGCHVVTVAGRARRPNKHCTIQSPRLQGWMWVVGDSVPFLTEPAPVASTHPPRLPPADSPGCHV